MFYKSVINLKNKNVLERKINKMMRLNASNLMFKGLFGGGKKNEEPQQPQGDCGLYSSLAVGKNVFVKVPNTRTYKNLSLADSIDVTEGPTEEAQKIIIHNKDGSTTITNFSIADSRPYTINALM